VRAALRNNGALLLAFSLREVGLLPLLGLTEAKRFVCLTERRIEGKIRFDPQMDQTERPHVSKTTRHGALCPLLGWLELVQSVERGYFVGFRQSGIVENRITEILDVRSQCENDLADVNDFRRPIAYGMHSQ
jgi:hypothetical protein